jgi:hypothetical protein
VYNSPYLQPLNSEDLPEFDVDSTQQYSHLGDDAQDFIGTRVAAFNSFIDDNGKWSEAEQAELPSVSQSKEFSNLRERFSTSHQPSADDGDAKDGFEFQASPPSTTTLINPPSTTHLLPASQLLAHDSTPAVPPRTNPSASTMTSQFAAAATGLSPSMQTNKPGSEESRTEASQLLATHMADFQIRADIHTAVDTYHVTALRALELSIQRFQETFENKKMFIFFSTE